MRLLGMYLLVQVFSQVLVECYSSLELSQVPHLNRKGLESFRRSPMQPRFPARTPSLWDKVRPHEILLILKLTLWWPGWAVATKSRGRWARNRAPSFQHIRRSHGVICRGQIFRPPKPITYNSEKISESNQLTLGQALTSIPRETAVMLSKSTSQATSSPKTRGHQYPRPPSIAVNRLQFVGMVAPQIYSGHSSSKFSRTSSCNFTRVTRVAHMINRCKISSLRELLGRIISSNKILMRGKAIKSRQREWMRRKVSQILSPFTMVRCSFQKTASPKQPNFKIIQQQNRASF